MQLYNSKPTLRRWQMCWSSLPQRFCSDCLKYVRFCVSQVNQKVVDQFNCVNFFQGQFNYAKFEVSKGQGLGTEYKHTMGKSFKNCMCYTPVHIALKKHHACIGQWVSAMNPDSSICWWKMLIGRIYKCDYQKWQHHWRSLWACYSRQIIKN